MSLVSTLENTGSDPQDTMVMWFLYIMMVIRMSMVGCSRKAVPGKKMPMISSMWYMVTTWMPLS